MNFLCLAALLLAAVAAAQDKCIVSDICFALDESGSVSVSNYNLEKDAVVDIAREISKGSSNTEYSAIRFSTSTRNIVDPTTDLEGVFVPAVEGAGKASGGTNIGAGLNACFQKLKDETGNRVIVLLTDGIGPVGTVPDTVKADGVKIVTVGIGNGVNEDLLKGVATAPNFFVKTSFASLMKDAMFIAETVCDVVMVGDPHIAGFDGVNFDFHGVHNRHYVVFGRRGGDLVVAKIQGEHVTDKNGVKYRTYFREFGFRPAGSTSEVRVAMMKCPLTGEWELGAELDGESSENSKMGKHAVSVVKNTSSKYTVTTAEGKYAIKMMWPEKSSAHLNFKVELLRSPQPSDEFEGVLGRTMNPAIGRDTDIDYVKGIKPAVREANLVKRFQVDNLFPKWNSGNGKNIRKLKASDKKLKGGASALS